MAVYSCPLLQHQSPASHHGLPVLLTCKAVMPCSSVDCALYFPLSNSLCIARNSPNLASCIKSCSTGSRGGLASRSLSSTLSRPSLPEALDAVLDVVLDALRWSDVADGSRGDIFDMSDDRYDRIRIMEEMPSYFKEKLTSHVRPPACRVAVSIRVRPSASRLGILGNP